VSSSVVSREGAVSDTVSVRTTSPPTSDDNLPSLGTLIHLLGGGKYKRNVRRIDSVRGVLVGPVQQRRERLPETQPRPVQQSRHELLSRDSLPRNGSTSVPSGYRLPAS
jgi:hypothetical protein